MIKLCSCFDNYGLDGRDKVSRDGFIPLPNQPHRQFGMYLEKTLDPYDGHGDGDGDLIAERWNVGGGVTQALGRSCSRPLTGSEALHETSERGIPYFIKR